MTGLNRREALVVLVSATTLPLIGCSREDTNFTALKLDVMASWMPPGVLKEDRRELGSSTGMVGATDYSTILRTFTASDASAALKGVDNARSVAFSNGWRERPDQGGRITTVLRNGAEASLDIAVTTNFPKTWWISLSA